MSQASAEFIPNSIAILNVSSRRGEEDENTGHLLR
ncbi:molybdenum cofactor biosynthesis protein, partial [Klebsiella quasipneumoniae]|nr:molybdenum cofactor biosynthesis protein [Klebsiella quasipneumoniae]